MAGGSSGTITFPSVSKFLLAVVIIALVAIALGAGNDEGADEPGATAEESVAAEETLEVLMTEGREVFLRTCYACHGPQGQGGVGPALDGHFLLRDTRFLVRTILNGIQGMPPHRDILTDREIAAVATYVRNSWSNSFGPVQEEEVAALR